MINIQEIEQEKVLAQLMADDLDKLYKKYQKTVFTAQKEREAKRIEKVYKGCKNERQLQDLYGYAEITLEELHNGIKYFQTNKVEYSTIELHRQNIKELRNRWLGTVAELQDELDSIAGGKPISMSDRLALAEREARYKNMY